MIIDCMVQVNKVSDLEEHDNMIEKLGLEPNPVDCYWSFDSLDITNAIRCHPFQPEETAAESCEEANGCAAIMWDDTTSVITNIPFDIFEAWWYKKRTDIVLNYDVKDKTLILMP